MADEGIFRFTALRAAREKERAPATRTRFLLYTDATRTAFAAEVEQARAGGATRGELAEIAARFKQTAQYVRDPRALPLDVTPLLAWAAENAGVEIARLKLDAALVSLYGMSAKQLAKTEAFQASYAALADTILADALLARDQAAGTVEDVTTAFKLLRLVAGRAEGESPPFDGTLGDFVAKVTIVVPGGPAPPPPDRGRPEEPPEPPEDDTERLRERLERLRGAHRELSRLVTDERALAVTGPEEGVADERVTALEQRVRELDMKLQRSGAEPLRPRVLSTSTSAAAGRVEVVVRREALASLSRPTRELLVELNLPAERLTPILAVTRLEDEMSEVGAQLASRQQPATYIMLGGVTLDARRVRESFGFGAPRERLERGEEAECRFAAGIGDLLLVRQTLKAYEVAEFAHVENVLIGESREREHRRLNLREEIEAITTETETQKERDLQSTERNELQNEASKTVREQFSLDAGLQVSGSYGPTVSFSASLNASFSTSVEETQRKATSYSREVTEKSAERTRELVREERRRRVLEQIEEINKHAIANTTAKHVRGIYRWLNKIYDAQVFNYGKRMMYEFVVPEPAAYLLYALVENPPDDLEVIRPDPPTYLGGPLKPSNLSRTNYHDYVAKYQVPNVPAPPPELQTVAHFDKQDGNTTNNFGRSGKLAIPDGYAAYGAYVHADYLFESGADKMHRIFLGGQYIDGSTTLVVGWRSFAPRPKELSIGQLLMNARAFVLAVDVSCQLTPDGFAKWQHATYDAIIAAYQRQKADYDEAVAAAAIRRGPQVLGRNPLQNRRMERDELKKLVIQMLLGASYMDVNSYYPGPGEPYVNIPAACENGAAIRFFENAFEWNNILYVLYPYFWGRHARWISALHLTDPDPDFAAFLKAGAARVQVPVRPGFERALAHFSQFGEIWEGHDPPLIDDDLYVPIIDEITESLGRPEAPPTPYPPDSKPWEVTVPTDLVIVQNLEEVAGLRDILTGKPITL